MQADGHLLLIRYLLTYAFGIECLEICMFVIYMTSLSCINLKEQVEN